MKIIIQDYLKELFGSHENGVDFIWKISPAKVVKASEIAGCLHHSGYWNIKINGKQYLRSRLRWLFETGQWPKENIDHINGIRHDDRIENLRECSTAENNQNHKIRKDNTSGFPGVFWFKPANKWSVQIKSNGKSNFGGYFDNLDNAITKAKEMKEYLHKFNPVQRV